MKAITQGSVVAGTYRLQGSLGQGALGEVWVAHHLRRDVRVAMKLMPAFPVTAGEARSRFEREVMVAALVESPHIGQILEHGVDEELPYVVMELLDGEDLGARLEREGRITIAAAAAIVAPICRALHRAHEAGVVHRDLKPQNLFFARVGGDEVVKVLDLGLSKALEPALAVEVQLLSSAPHCMSPEQVAGSKAIDFRSDLWSLAVTLFRALTGHLPFPGNDMAEVLTAIDAGDVPIPSDLAPDLGPEADRFFARALARDPRRRLQSARAFGEAFAALASRRDAVTQPCPPPSSPRLRCHSYSEGQSADETEDHRHEDSGVFSVARRAEEALRAAEEAPPAAEEQAPQSSYDRVNSMSIACLPPRLPVRATMAAAGAIILGIVLAVIALERPPAQAPSLSAPAGQLRR